MRFLADENIFSPIVSFLRNSGHDVKSIRESSLFKIKDDDIVEMATREERTIITFDKHFGDILRYPPDSLHGIILIRIHPPILDDVISALKHLFKKYNAELFKGRLIVLSKSGYRIR